MYIVFLALFGLGFLLFASPVAIYGVFNIGNIAGMLLFGGAFVCVLLRKRLKTAWRKKGGRIALSVAAALLAAGLTVAAVTGVKIVRAAANAPKEDEACTVVVLGCRVYDSGPSRMLISRVNAAAAFLKAHPDVYCVVSGGQGEDEPMSEAQCMYDMLVDRDIAPERILTEDASRSTRENIEFSLAIIKEKGLPERLALVTNEYHLCRASMVASAFGCESRAISARSQYILLPTYFVREIFGVLWEELTGGLRIG